MLFSKSPSPFVKRLRSVAHFDPVRDWLVMLTLSTIALVGIVVWNVWAFDTVAGGGTIGTAKTASPPTFNSSSFDEIRLIFDRRAAEEAKYETGIYKFTDPSL